MDLEEKVKTYWPAVIVLLVAIGFLLYRLSIKDWDPVALAEIGTRYRDGDSHGTEGYDGQFAYYIALQPDPDEVSSQLDVAAYRYQRIFYPLLARILSLGKENRIPWTLILVNILSQVAGTAFLCKMSRSKGIPVRYSLIYGLWAGSVIGVATDLYEPLAFGFVLAAMFYRSVEKHWLVCILFTCSLLTKETTILFWAAALIADLTQKGKKRALLLSLMPGLVYGLWQGWLYAQFGAFGLASGGAMATSFEWIPYAGFFRIASAGMEIFVLFLIIFGPTILLPNSWGMIASMRMLLAGHLGYVNWALLLNTLFITFLPFSTFREPLGLVRVSTGLVLATVVFSAQHDLRRALNLGMFWIALLAILVR